MIKKALIPAVIALVVLIYFTQEEENPEAYLTQIEQERIEKNRSMSTASDSPFNIYGDTTVKLIYYPVNRKYKVTAKIELIEERQYLTLGSSDGIPVKYLKYAYAQFRIDDQPYKLLILKDHKSPNGGLFTAFADETSSEETYGAGRYLDLDFKRAKRIELDFNRAYNPYCAYNDNYSCPFPPPENVLSVKIEAGEKSYH